MKKYSLLLLSVFCAVFAVKAQQLSDMEARSVASDFLEQKNKSVESQALQVEDIEIEGNTVAKLVTDPEQGFVLMAPDKRMKPVIGYSLKNDFDPSNMAPALEDWLKQLASGSLVNREVHPEWERIAGGGAAIKGKGFPEVTQLMTARWGQSWPYNADCPEHPNGSNGHTLVGCVATAMAQIMYYWEYPDSGQGSETYYWGQQYTVNFEEATYDYSQMDDVIYSQNQDHIAELSFHTAVSVKMNFGPASSGSSIKNAESALKQNFSYIPTLRYRERTNYTDVEWENIIQNEMLSGRPVLYAGVDSSQGGHAFVLDGFRDSCYFHINWGWNGGNNGYYHLNDMSSSGGNFSLNHRAVTGIMPIGESRCGDYWMTVPDYTFDDGSGYSYYPNNISCSYLIEHPENGPLDLQFTKWQLADAEDEVTIYDGKNENAPVLAKYDGTDTPALLTSSSNKVFITFETNDNGKDLGWDLKYSTKATTVKEHDWQKLTVAPNPAENQAIISGAPKGKLNVFSMDGRKVFHENNGIEDRYSLDVSNMPQGIYMVEIISEAGERNVQKLIVR